MAFEGENEEVETVGLEEVWRWFVLLFFNVFSTWLPVGSLAVACELSVAACGIQFSEHGVVASEPPGKSLGLSSL